MIPSTNLWQLPFLLPSIGLLLGFLVGWLLCWIYVQSRTEKLRVEVARLQEVAVIEQNKSQWLNSAMGQMQSTFEALASKSLQNNADEFLKRAGERVDAVVSHVRSDWITQKAEFNGVVTPLKENLTALDNYVRELEQKREGAYQGVQEQLRQLAQTQNTLQTTTMTLAQALRAPNVRGRWGEIQLRRVVEMAGMVKNVHFVEQFSTEGGRPDLISYLPNKGILRYDCT